MRSGDEVRLEGDDLVAWGVHKSLVIAFGSVLSTLSLVLGLMAASATVGGGSSTTAVYWVVVLVVCAVLMGLLCLVQNRFWQRAIRRWQAGDAATSVERPSWVVHLASYGVVVAGIFAGVSASHDVGFAGSVATLATLALVPLVAAQVIAGVQVVRTGGPAGTVPTHVRRLGARIERSRHED